MICKVNATLQCRRPCIVRVIRQTAHSGLCWQQPLMLAVGEDGDLLNLGEKKKKKKKKQTSEVVVNMITYSKLASSQGQAPKEGL